MLVSQATGFLVSFIDTAQVGHTQKMLSFPKVLDLKMVVLNPRGIR